MVSWESRFPLFLVVAALQLIGCDSFAPLMIHHNSLSWLSTTSATSNNNILQQGQRRIPPFSSFSSLPYSSSLVLLWAKKSNARQQRRGAGGGGAATKSKKKKKKNHNGQQQQPLSSRQNFDDNDDESFSQPSRPVATNLPATNNQKRTKSGSKPPWQVLSPKEAKKNIQKEKERRALAQQGIQQQHASGQHQQNGQKQQPTLSSSLLNEADRRLLKWKRFSPTATSALSTRLVGSYLDERLSTAKIQLGVPQVAFLGRSNVGKSSLLNRLLLGSSSKRGDTARVGKTPGATARVNVYGLHRQAQKPAKHNTPNNNISDNDKLLLGLVDLPGFGYAKLSKSTQASVQEAAERYLSLASGQGKGELALGLLLVDARRDQVSDDDRAVLAALYDLGLPLVVVATKIDKVPEQQREQHLEKIRNGLGLPEGQPLAVSSVTGEGMKRLWSIVLDACETCVKEVARVYREEEDDDHDENDDDDHSDNDDDLAVFEDDDDDLAYSQGYDWIHDYSESHSADAEYGYQSY